MTRSVIREKGVLDGGSLVGRLFSEESASEEEAEWLGGVGGGRAAGQAHTAVMCSFWKEAWL